MPQHTDQPRHRVVLRIRRDPLELALRRRAERHGRRRATEFSLLVRGKGWVTIRYNWAKTTHCLLFGHRFIMRFVVDYMIPDGKNAFCGPGRKKRRQTNKKRNKA